MIRVVVLGNGNIGTHLCTALEKNNRVLLLQNYNRKGEKIINCNVPITQKISQITHADIYIIAFNDSSLYDLKDFESLNGLVIHTSGATPMNVLTQFENHGVFYPLQSFNKNINIDFSEIPIAIEANNSIGENLLLKLAQLLSNKVFKINSKQRLALHTSAVFANNFSNFMYTNAQEICSQNQIDFNILKPLIFETIKKLNTSLPSKIQTGPAVRNDIETINKHQEILTNPDQKELYSILTRAIQNYYGEKL